MRVIIVTETYLPYLSGVTVSTEVAARGLGRRGHTVMLLAPRARRGVPVGTAGAAGPEPEYAWLPSYQLPRPVPFGYRMPSMIPNAPTFRRALAFRPEIVHAQSPFVAGSIARSIARRAGVPLVQTHHTRLTEYRHYLWPVSEIGAALVDGHTRRFWASCDAVIAPSRDFAIEVSGALGEGSRTIVRAIPTGIDLDTIDRVRAADLRSLHDWPADAVVVVSLGRLGKEKNVEFLLEAFALAARRTPALHLVLVGGGPLESTLRRRAAAPDLTGRVAFTGGLPRLDALAHLKGADLFAFASQTETQGLVLAEALACGVPVVALDGPGVRDSLDHDRNAIVVPRDEPNGPTLALANAMCRLAHDAALRADFAREARRTAREADVDVRLGALEALYEHVLAQRVPSRTAPLPRS
ncbi:MAG: glycosyltransferase [Trueperaceae bacterium]|nr:glycosyltransferase [Trueperaceae bacterium]